MLLAALAAVCLAQASAPTGSGSSAVEERARLERSLERGRRWLLERRDDDGVFRPIAVPSVCPVALSALAAWALARAGTAVDELATTADFLVAHVQEDEGLYDPAHGLAVYTSGVAVQALRSLGFADSTPERRRLLNQLELFVYRRADPESLVDAEKGEATPSRAPEQARALLQEGRALPASTRAALEFLARCRRDATLPAGRLRIPGHEADAGFGYDDLLPMVYRSLQPEHQIVQRALARIRASFTLERNPDLTRRFGEDGFQPGSQGLFYYYLVLARLLATRRSRTLALADGREVDWSRALSARLESLERPDGAWVNADLRWWEGEPVLVTSYALLALSLCRDTALEETQH